MALNDYFSKFKNKALFEDPRSIEDCFKYFDKDGDGELNYSEFESLLKILYSFNGSPYYISSAKIQKIFKYFDHDTDTKINLDDFRIFWNKAVKAALFPRSALIIVDVQKDFIDGTLALKHCPAKEEGYEVVPIINELIEKVPFDLVVYTQDWHPADHISFYENVKLRPLTKKYQTLKIKPYEIVKFETANKSEDIEQKLWPVHCVQHSDGANFDDNLTIISDKDRLLIVQKGTNSEIDSYSAFFDNSKASKTKLDDELRNRGITDLYVCGLATDYCVASTANDGLELKYRVVLIENACRGVDAEQIVLTKKRLINRGALIVNSKQVHKMVLSEDRRPELLYPAINMDK